MNTTQKTYLVALLAVGVDCALVVMAPLCAQRGPAWLALLIYEHYSRWCHQMPARSFFLYQYPLALCHRCTGIHFGVLVGLLLYPWLTRLARTRLPGRALILGAAVPIGLDILLPWLGGYENTVRSRVTTGLLLGGVLAFYLMPGLVDMVRFFSFRHRRSSPEFAGAPPGSPGLPACAPSERRAADTEGPNRKEVSWI